MRKLWPIFLTVIAFLAVLFVPIPTSAYRDGGTRTYTALTYKVIDWNRLTVDGKYEATKLYWFPDNFKSIDELWKREEQNAAYRFVATILEMDDTTALVQPVEGEEELASCDRFRIWLAKLDNIGAEVGSVVEITYTGTIRESYPAQIDAIRWALIEPDDCPVVAYKPVIYLYPEAETEVSVELLLDGELTCTYPAYNSGWKVTAAPDGTLTGTDGQIYNYLYWEGVTSARWDMSKGFCIKGEETAAFLEDALEKLGLTRREANEFIVYWLPLMEQNPYNIIAFQTMAYTQAAQLRVQPAPDTTIRVFMTWQPTDKYIALPAQDLSAPARIGFTVVEWGGSQVSG